MYRSVPRVNELPSQEDFVQNYLKPGNPVIFPILPCGALDWTMESLSARVGDTKVFTRINTAMHDYRVSTTVTDLERLAVKERE